MDYAAAKNAALPTRPHARAALATETFDVLVIGGGITGAGIAFDAASRGLRVALVEKGDYASGTSSKSTKLIHGGLRYLKQLDIALVREVGLERATVHRIAPHLVQPEKMLIPILRDGQMGKLTTSLALWVYDKLADVDGDDQRQMLSREEALAHEPLLDPTRVEGGALYAEYRTDDARLTIENLKTAAGLGAVCVNYARVDDLLLDGDGCVVGARVSDQLLGGEPLAVRARVVVNAAGPWVDFIREIDGSLAGKRVFHAKGVHFVVPRERFPVQQSIYFDLPDGRMCFAIPRGRATYFGTTDTPYEANPDAVAPDSRDLAYLLDGANAMFPGLDLRADDIESSWAGLRPLIYEPGKSASEMSRRDEIFESASGLLSIAGGKLTGYRKMSERIVDRVVERLGGGVSSATAELAIAGNDFPNYDSVISYRAHVRDLLEEHGLPPARADYLVHLYGVQAPDILRLTDAPGALDAVAADGDDPEFRLALAELRFAIAREQVVRLEDFVVRRTGRMYFDKRHLDAMLPGLMRGFAAMTQLPAAKAAEQLADLRELSRVHAEFDDYVGA